jgi:hypothetical protein
MLPRGSRRARAKLAELLGSRSDTMILASATPHDGRPESFASLMNMPNPTAIANPKQYGPADIEGLCLRRFKKDVQEQLTKSILDRKTVRCRRPATDPDDAAYERLTHFSFLSFDKTKKIGHLLFWTVLVKAIFSSPAAGRKTYYQRLPRSGPIPPPKASHDRDTGKPSPRDPSHMR